MNRLARLLIGIVTPVGLLAPSGALGAAGDDTEEMSAECVAFRQDVDADLGDVLRAGCSPTIEQMSRLMDNPLGNVAMFFNQVDLFALTNDDVGGEPNEYQVNYMGILQFPKGISENWNIINRVVYNISSVPLDQDKISAFGANPPEPPFIAPPGSGPGQPPQGGFLPIDLFGGRTDGFGDLYYVGLLSPKEAIKHGEGKISVWGIGLNAGFPTASDDVLGTGKWQLGPSALYAYMGPRWKIGALAQNYFSFAGPSRRDEVRLTNLQYFVYFSLTDTMSIGAGPNVIMNWQADSGDKFTVPVGLGINKTFQFGKVPVRFGVEFHYNVERPNNVGSEWNFRFFVIPAAPSALFKWMQ